MFPITSGPPPALVRLTRQQARTLAAVAITTNRREAAALLGISPSTATAHLSAVFARLPAASLTEALWRIGWLDPPLELLELPGREWDGLVWIGGVG